jgi:hypothetical protein
MWNTAGVRGSNASGLRSAFFIQSPIHGGRDIIISFADISKADISVVVIVHGNCHFVKGEMPGERVEDLMHDEWRGPLAWFIEKTKKYIFINLLKKHLTPL